MIATGMDGRWALKISTHGMQLSRFALRAYLTTVQTPRGCLTISRGPSRARTPRLALLRHVRQSSCSATLRCLATRVAWLREQHAYQHVPTRATQQSRFNVAHSHRYEDRGHVHRSLKSSIHNVSRSQTTMLNANTLLSSVHPTILILYRSHVRQLSNPSQQLVLPQLRYYHTARVTGEVLIFHLAKYVPTPRPVKDSLSNELHVAVSLAFGPSANGHDAAHFHTTGDIVRLRPFFGRVPPSPSTTGSTGKSSVQIQ
jgi:hypothetical protein